MVIIRLETRGKGRWRVFEIHTARGGTMLTDSRLSELLNRWHDLSEQGRDVSAEDLCADCPGLAAELGRLIKELKAIGTVIRPGSPRTRGPSSLRHRPKGKPHSHRARQPRPSLARDTVLSTSMPRGISARFTWRVTRNFSGESRSR